MLGTLSKLYGSIIRRRNAKYDAHRKPIVSVTVPVISVGNLTVGGTGKTVIVQMIVRMLQAHGYKPAIVMRGYKRSARGVAVVHDGSNTTASVRESGDEAALHAQKLGVPVVVGESKVDAAVHAAGFLPCDVIVVDDGFQHRSLHRDADVVLVDNTTLSDTRLLPAGRLREPLTALRRADVIVIMDRDVEAASLQQFVSPDSLVCSAQVHAHCPTSIGTPVISMCAIAQPQRFKQTLEDCGLNVVRSFVFRDHHVYTKTDISNVIRAAETHGAAIVTTEKDDVKLSHAHAMFTAHGITYRVIPIEAKIIDNDSMFDYYILSRIGHENRNQ
ncbi:MAG: tetraacyldisaccharide 4'-kinase [Ignavibacteria bacterium]|nr:tetraacyldisaccharide 4'-kinase [Ignavibacteria bacterium]